MGKAAVRDTEEEKGGFIGRKPRKGPFRDYDRQETKEQ